MRFSVKPFDALDELQAHHMVHFDAHLANIVTDGSSCTIVDFGLAMSESFELSLEDRSFLNAHRHYDYGCVLAYLGAMLAIALREDPALATLRTHFDKLPALEGSCPSGLLGAIDRYRSPILYMFDFFERIRQPDKTSIYEDRVFVDLLRTCGPWVAESEPGNSTTSRPRARIAGGAAIPFACGAPSSPGRVTNGYGYSRPVVSSTACSSRPAGLGGRLGVRRAPPSTEGTPAILFGPD